MKAYYDGTNVIIGCIGCRHLHVMDAKRWHWNNSNDKPTLQPSVLNTTGPFPDGHKEICHFFVNDGKIQYLGDCTHHLAGQTINLPEIKSTLGFDHPWYEVDYDRPVQD